MLVSLTLTAGAQTAAPTPASPLAAKQAVDYRKAAFTLIGADFKPLGAIMQGRAPYQPEAARKYASRLVVLAELLDEAFPEISKTGDTRARPEIWSDRADFEARLKDFHAHAAALTQLVQSPAVTPDAFKTAAFTVAQDCKSCHDHYRSE